MNILLLIPILLPIIFSLISLVNYNKIKNEKLFKKLGFIITLLNSIIVFIFLFIIDDSKLLLVHFTDKLEIVLKLDGLGKVFSGMVSILWPIALIYAYTYMEHHENRIKYYSYYILVFGVVLGIAFSGNLITMYFFYELLTFMTLPLIIHIRNKETMKAGRTYLIFSLSGSSLALAGLVILTSLCGTTDFDFGGHTNLNTPLAQVAYLLTFFGFGVKSAVFPLGYWLPMAGVAPTPTTALLHAVAVVKAGAFAIMRSTYYCFSYEYLNTSVAQIIALSFIAFTIIYGSTKALKEQHFKRRMAYSTISNLSYILLGVLLCNKLGLVAALLHFIYHSFSKIGIFFSVGAIIENSEAHYVYELNGLGKKMPIIFTIYTICALSITGIPFTCGFVSKYHLLIETFKTNTVMGYIGGGALIISAILTLIYSLGISFRAFVRDPIKGYEKYYNNAKEPNKGFIITCGIFAVLALVLGIFSNPINNLFLQLVGGLA